MITPFLEKLILSGNATFNTFVIGGTEKHILNVASNRFIIITDIIYFNEVNNTNENKVKNYRYDRQDVPNFLVERSLTQCTIFSEKSFNTFVFRNNFSFVPDGNAHIIVTPIGSTKLDTYLIHESDVAFTFCWAGKTAGNFIGPTPAGSVGAPNPIDYNKEGGYGNIDSVRLRGQSDSLSPTFWFKPGGNKVPDLPGAQNSLQLQFPVNTLTRLDDLELPLSYPLMLVNYVEIQGNPTNVSATL